MSTPAERMQNLYEAFADDIEQMSDEELLQELREDGEDPEAIAAHTREVLRSAYETWKARQSHS